MNTLIGRTLKNYKIIELLGQGGMAQVYRAERLPSGEQVALKVMHPHLVTETDFLRRFYREAKAIATLKHPNIIKVYDFIPPGDIASPCIIMQLVKGPTLQACLAEAARFGETWSLNAVLHLIEPLAGAIDYAHSRGMIHRDIKPTNIILQPVPPASPIPFYEKGYTLTSISSLPILTDFGMARLVDDTRLTMTGAVAGTPTYISPEQANGQPAGPASDLYSFGVVAYEMVTGQAPFAADTPMATMFQHMNAAPPSPGQLRPNLNPAIDKVLLKALAKNPADRYPNAQTFARFLRQAIETGTVPQEIMAHTFTVAGQFGPGSVIDNRYHVEAVLGQGAFSQVYKVTDRQEGEPFALKIIADRELGLDHLKREFRALSKLRHPSIARVVDAGQLRSGQYYLKLEFVAGKSLETCMAEDLLSEEKKVELLEDILDALVYMEGQGFLHRDLKPSNIIVTTTGASIIDFNVSKPLAEATRTQVGTPRYMPPEVPHVGWNKTGDLYAVGLIFYELFTGRLPFLDAASLSAWDIPDPREFAPALPEGIARVLVKAIARKPEDRFAGAAGMLAAARRARIQSGVPGKVSPHIAPAAPAAEPATPTRPPQPISLKTVAHLHSPLQRGSGAPLAVGPGPGDGSLTIITAAAIESAAPDTLATRRVIWRSSEPLAAGVVALGGQSAAVVTTGHRLHSVALPAGEQPGRSLQLPAAAAGLSLDPAGKTIALCLRNRQGLLIALADGRIVHRWEWGFPAAAFNPAGDAAAFVDAAGMIRLYRLDPLAEITRFDLQREAVSALAFSAGGGELWAAGKKFLRWQINSARRLPSLPGIKEGAAVFALSPHGDGLLAGNDREVVFWAADGRRKLGSVRLAGVRAACFAAPALAALVQPGGAVQMCRLPNRRIVAARPFDSFACAALSPDGQLILTGDGRGVVKGWRAESGEPVFAWQSNHKPVSAIAMHPFKPLAAVATSKTLWYLDLAGPQPQPAGERQIDGPAGRLAFSSDGRRLLLQKPGRAWLIDPADHRAKPLPLKADAAAFAADNQILATVRKGKLTWVDAASGQQRPTAAVPPAREMAFNGSGSLLAIAAQEGGVSLWNKAGKRIFNLQNVEASLRDLTFAPDDLLLTAIDSAGRLAFWDAAIAARQAAIPAHNGPARIAGYSQNGHTLVTAGRDGLVRWWQA